MRKVAPLAEYSEIVLQHYQSPSNLGKIEQPDGLGEYASDACGDVVRFYLEVNNEIITEVKFQCFGCVGSVACSDMLAQIVFEAEIETAYNVSETDILSALSGLSEEKSHCASLAIGALRRAIEDYRRAKVSR